MKKIFQASTRLSFGLGSHFFKIEQKGSTLYITEGTPQQPKKSFKIKNFSNDDINKILSLENVYENCDYIKHIIFNSYELSAWKNK